MRDKYFYTLLLLTIVSSLVIAFVFRSLDEFSFYFNFILASISLFIILSIGVYYLAKMAALSTNKYVFIYLVMFNIIFKILASVILVIAYAKFYDPPDRMFLMPFMFIYLLFTIFETFVMSKLARLKPKENTNG